MRSKEKDEKKGKFTLAFPAGVWYNKQALKKRNSAEWSSPVARRAHNPKAAGSNPASATKNPHGKPLCGFSLAIFLSQICCGWDFFTR